MKQTTVVFTRNNARVLVNHKPRLGYNPTNRVVLQPDLSLVRGVPTHHWKLDSGQIVEMSPVEKRRRNIHIKLYGIDNNVDKELYPSSNRLLLPLIIMTALVIILIGAIVYMKGSNNGRDSVSPGAPSSAIKPAH